MDAHVLDAVGQAFLLVSDPHRLLILFAGVCMGLALGILPGIGGVAGTALLLPFTYNMDPPTAMAMLLGFAATTTTADPISAIVLGAPGHAASAATALDGYPMTQRGEGGRALGASYMSAMIGGLFGALVLGAMLPLVRPLMLHIGAPELLSLAVFGLSMVATLSGNTPLRGLTAACFGMMLAMIGGDPQTGTLRWTLDSVYLMDGLPLVPLTLGIFALPELCDLMVGRSTISRNARPERAREGGLSHGVRDCFRNWFLVLRCSGIGAALGAVPGIGAAVIDWISYGHALRTEKGARDTFGRGDVRGVIAAESATNSREGGALIPTIVFGVPSSPGMAILLGAFLMHGLVPGPDMLSKNLAISYSMVWSIAVANLLGSGLCFLLSGHFARLATLRHTLILPVVLCLIFIGAFEGKREWGDLYSLLAFGVLGWAFKHFKWPRPPLVLGFILGSVLERYMFISIQRYELAWLTRPVVVLMFALSALTLLRPLLAGIRQRGGRRLPAGFGRPRLSFPVLLPAVLLCLFAAMLAQALTWNLYARIIPLIVGAGAVVFCAASLFTELCKATPAARQPGGMPAVPAAAGHMDVASSIAHLTGRQVLGRGAVFFLYLAGFMASMWLIGLIPTVPVFVSVLMYVEGRERWRVIAPMAAGMTLLIYGVFDQLLEVPWPPTVLGTWFPVLHAIPSA
ncbi:tripartite tricarboxylate transporter permease [Pigmentiphaga soli]|uniref:Tripartite tricarboxylate transporter permease n=1 Tax=Pigmentiphaga soli TaxID=1007095 RepID=A0ABP8HEX4_9BURK